MANFSQNITNTVRTFGGGPASLWNAHNWNAFNWGEGTNAMGKLVRKVVLNSQANDSAYPRKNVLHLLDSQALATGDLFAKAASIRVTGTVVAGGDMASEKLSDGSGYNYVFTSNATNAEDRDETSWASAAVNDATWTTASVGTTTWS